MGGKGVREIEREREEESKKNKEREREKEQFKKWEGSETVTGKVGTIKKERGR